VPSGASTGTSFTRLNSMGVPSLTVRAVAGDSAGRGAVLGGAVGGAVGGAEVGDAGILLAAIASGGFAGGGCCCLGLGAGGTFDGG
jgi:hypothetical protein